MNIIQIGCADGNDKLLKLLQQEENKNDFHNVLLVDANPDCIEDAKKTYENSKHNIEFLNIAVLDKELPQKEKVSFFIPIRKKSRDMSSLDKTMTSKLCNGDVREISVKAMHVDVLFKYFNKEVVDWLFLDAEGFDCRIILSMDLNICNFKNMYFEIAHSDGVNTFASTEIFKKCFDKLVKNNYNVFGDPEDVWNAYAIKKN